MSGHYNTFNTAPRPSAAALEPDVVLSYLDDLVNPASGNPDGEGPTAHLGCGGDVPCTIKVAKVMLLLGLSMSVAAAGWIQGTPLQALPADATNHQTMRNMRGVERSIKAHSLQPVEWLEAASVVDGRVVEDGSFSRAKFDCLFTASRYRVVRKVCIHRGNGAVAVVAAAVAEAEAEAHSDEDEPAAVCQDRYYVHNGRGEDANFLPAYSDLIPGAEGGSPEDTASTGGGYRIFDSFADAVFSRKPGQLAAGTAALHPEATKNFKLYIGLDPSAKRRSTTDLCTSSQYEQDLQDTGGLGPWLRLRTQELIAEDTSRAAAAAAAGSSSTSTLADWRAALRPAV